MTRGVFISWSGEKSQKIGKALSDWLPSVLQFVRPFYSPDDIDKGTKWVSELSKKLSECDIGITCLTGDNLNKPWILFEAGALSKQLAGSNVCTVLFGLEPAELNAPLANFNTTRFNKDDFRKLIKTINKTNNEDALQDNMVDQVFEKWWPDLEVEISKILSEKAGPRPAKRSDREILEEILDGMRQSRFRTQTDYPTNTRIPSRLIHEFTLEIDKMVNLAELEASGEMIDISIKIIKMFRFICRNGDRDQLQLIDDLLKRTSEVFLSAEKT